MGAGKGIQGHGNGTPREQVVQVPITKTIQFQGVQVDAQSTPDGGRNLIIVNPGAGEVYVVPMGADLARELGGKLISSVPIAKPGEMPG